MKVEANLPRVVTTTVGTSRTRFTGPPTGLDPRLVPQCQICSQRMSFVGQYGDVEHPLLGGGDVVYAFICLEDSCALDAGVPGHEIPPAHRVVVAQFDPAFATDGPSIEWQPIYEEYPAHLSDFLFECKGTSAVELELLRVASLVHGAAKWGGVPAWVQPPHFGESGIRYRYTAQWSDVVMSADAGLLLTNVDVGRVFLLESSRSENGFDLALQVR